MNLITQLNQQNDVLTAIANNPELQPSTKKQYTKAVTNYLATGNSLTDAQALSEYAQDISKSSRSFLKAAIRLWGDKVALDAKAGATPENIAAVQATVYRLEALNGAIKVEATKGQKAHSWLSQSEVKALLDTCNTKTVQGRRDRIVLGLLVGAGLRRAELTNLRFDDFVPQPNGGTTRMVLNVTGKGAKNRIVPVNDRLAEAISDWGEFVGTSKIARSVSKGGMVKDSLSAIGIFHIVRNAGKAIGKPNLAPHDLRRTFAQLGYDAGIPITQISKLLGHSSIDTTQKYLNLDLNLVTTVSDFIPF